MIRVRALAGLAVASAVLLTGCGAVPDLNPGVAVSVGDDTVSTRHVADLASDYCDAAKPQLEGQPLLADVADDAGATVVRPRYARQRLFAQKAEVLVGNKSLVGLSASRKHNGPDIGHRACRLLAAHISG